MSPPPVAPEADRRRKQLTKRRQTHLSAEKHKGCEMLTAGEGNLDRNCDVEANAEMYREVQSTFDAHRRCEGTLARGCDEKFVPMYPDVQRVRNAHRRCVL